MIGILPQSRRLDRCAIGTRVALMLCICLSTQFAAGQNPNGSQKSNESSGEVEESLAAVERSVGIEGIYYLRTTGLGLQAKPFDKTSPLLIRIASEDRDDDIVIHEIRFIGFHPGVYDLRDFLTNLDGTKLSGVPPAEVSIVSVLPEDHSGELAGIQSPPLPRAWPYRALLWFAVVLWLLPLAWWVKRRLENRRVVVEQTSRSPAPSLADRLKPLVVAVLEGRSSPREQAELERMLLGHWRAELNLTEQNSQQALKELRADPKAGVLVRQLDAWLHMPPGRESVDVAELLEPYRNVSAEAAS